ncbi:MAG: methylated-DNA--[protein]-cysteine S-methyltransferase [Bacillota bacterium]|nr:methylated-DNA--[protein]-cysteine S-methyltransferase [Bacillota bacterium]
MERIWFYETPLGTLCIGEGAGCITRVTWTKIPTDAVQEETEGIRCCYEQLTEYFAGERREFDLPLQPMGTPFQQRVWEALQNIPYGETRTYGEIAKAIGKPGAARAVGMANHKNPIGILIPCHRVIGADGRLTGYAGGLEKKEFLLELERRQ